MKYTRFKMNLIDTYRYNDDYYIDIVHLHGYYESWVYHEGYGIKMLMFGMPTSDISKKEFVDLAFSKIDEYIRDYKSEYED